MSYSSSVPNELHACIAVTLREIAHRPDHVTTLFSVRTRGRPAGRHSTLSPLGRERALRTPLSSTFVPMYLSHSKTAQQQALRVNRYNLRYTTSAHSNLSALKPSELRSSHNVSNNKSNEISTPRSSVCTPRMQGKWGMLLALLPPRLCLPHPSQVVLLATRDWTFRSL